MHTHAWVTVSQLPQRLVPVREVEWGAETLESILAARRPVVVKHAPVPSWSWQDAQTQARLLRVRACLCADATIGKWHVPFSNALWCDNHIRSEYSAPFCAYLFSFRSAALLLLQSAP